MLFLYKIPGKINRSVVDEEDLTKISIDGSAFLEKSNLKIFFTKLEFRLRLNLSLAIFVLPQQLVFDFLK